MDKNKIFSIYKQAFHNFIVSLSSIVSTGFFVGKIKYASGTFGSLLAIILCIPFCKLGILSQFLIVIFMAIVGTTSTHFYLQSLGDMKKDPKEVVIDEILAVGDQHFQEKCISKMKELKEQGKTMVFVTHSMNTVKQFCTRAIWLNKGTIKMDGKPEEVIEKYLKETL